MPNSESTKCMSISCNSMVGYTGDSGYCICVPGYYGSPMYTDNGELTGCKICPLGFYCKGDGSKISCLQGNSCPQKSPNPTLCLNGTYSAADLSSCIKCQANYWSYAGSASCFSISCTQLVGYEGLPSSCACKEGYTGVVNYIEGLLSGCTECGEGYYNFFFKIFIHDNLLFLLNILYTFNNNYLIIFTGYYCIKNSNNKVACPKGIYNIL